MAYLKAYYDESFSHHTTDPRLMVVGGCTMTSDSWTKLEPEWRHILNNFGVQVHRSSDCNTSKGEFLGWDGPKKDTYREQLITTIRRSWSGAPISAVFTSISLDICLFESVALEFPKAKLSAYECCVLGVIAGSKHAIANIQGENTLGLFFEEGQGVRPHIRRALHDAKRSEYRIMDISFVKKKDHTPLQVADMVASEVFKSEFEGMRKALMDLLTKGASAGIRFSEADIRDAFINWHPYLT